MSERKKPKTGCKQERKAPTPIEQPKESPRMEYERRVAEYERIAAPLRQAFIGFAESKALRRKVNDTLMMLTSDNVSDAWMGDGEEPVEHKVRRALWMDSRVAISEVLQNTFNDLLWVIEYREGDIAEECARIVINTLTGTLNQIKRLYGNPKKLEMFRRLARTRLEFPSLLSLFNKENRDMERCILDGLQLGAEQPFAPDPRKTYTPYTVLAMGIVRWISFHSSQQSNSMYRKVVPGIEKMDFCDEHAAAWTRAIEFHLDFYQAPKKTREKTAFANGLEEDFQHNEANRASCIVEIKDANEAVISTSRPSWLEFLGAYGEITRMREFKNLLKSERDKQITGEGSLYSRVRGKVVEAAMTLMREKSGKLANSKPTRKNQKH